MKNVTINANKTVRLIDTMTNRKYNKGWGMSLADRVRRWHLFEENHKKHLALYNRPRCCEQR